MGKVGPVSSSLPSYKENKFTIIIPYNTFLDYGLTLLPGGILCAAGSAACLALSSSSFAERRALHHPV